MAKTTLKLPGVENIKQNLFEIVFVCLITVSNNFGERQHRIKYCGIPEKGLNLTINYLS